MDDHDQDHDDWRGFPGELGPYKPLHPWREAFTFALFVILIAAALWWIFHALWGQFVG